MSEVKIKVCGMTQLSQVEQLVRLRVDYAGFIFYEKSPRYVEGKILAVELKNLQGIKKVGVFVNEDEEVLFKKVTDYGLHYVQLHGDESPEYCKRIALKVPVIKAFRVSGDEEFLKMVAPYNDAASMYLFDTKAKEYGGTGQKFDWQLLKHNTLEKPFFLSGGISSDDVNEVREFIADRNESEIIIDLNSRFEIEPGIKNIPSLEKFIVAIKNPAGSRAE